MDSLFSNNNTNITFEKNTYTVPSHIFIKLPEDTDSSTNIDNEIGLHNRVVTPSDMETNTGTKTDTYVTTIANIIRKDEYDEYDIIDGGQITTSASGTQFGLYELPDKHIYFPGAYSLVVVYEDKVNKGHINSKIVLKVMRDTKRYGKKIQTEIDIYNRLRNSKLGNYYNHICKCFGTESIINNKAKYKYLTLEYMKTDLFDYIFKNERTYTMQTVYSISLQIAKGLDFLHKHKIIYNDLKLENIMIRSIIYNSNTNRRDFKIKLIDFNCSTIFMKNTQANYLAHGGGGTLEYMSPELQKCVNTNNFNLLTYKSDIWSLGVVICLLILHKQPYEDIDNKQIIAKIKENEYNDYNKCKDFIKYCSYKFSPPYLKINNLDRKFLLNIMDNCLKTKPRHRYKMKDIISILEQMNKL